MTEKKKLASLPFFTVILLAIGFVYRFGAQWLRSVLIMLSHASWARKLITHFSLARRVAQRFVAGEQIEAALVAARVLNEKGMLVTLDYLGENVTTEQDAADARDHIIQLLQEIKNWGVDANVSVKLSQLGLRISPDLARENVRLILLKAKELGNKIRIDMEESEVTATTLQIYRTLRDDIGFAHRVGIVVQSYLYRTESDVHELINAGAWIRLCKGAYAESPDVAFAKKSDTDASYVKLMKLMISDGARAKGVYAGIATHDEKMIQATIDEVKAHAVPQSDFEFQMLYGIRRDLQEQLVADGYRVRIYVPYGTAWYPYMVRRLAEHPANLWFFASNLIRR